MSNVGQTRLDVERCWAEFGGVRGRMWSDFDDVCTDVEVSLVWSSSGKSRLRLAITSGVMANFSGNKVRVSGQTPGLS